MICKDYTTFREAFGTPGTVAIDGHRTWPSAKVSADVTFYSVPGEGFGFPFYCGAFASAPSGMTLYLSQGTDDPVKKSLRVVEILAGGPLLSFGAMLHLTTVGVERLGYDPDQHMLTDEDARILFQGSSLYLMNNATGNIKAVDLYKQFGGDDE